MESEGPNCAGGLRMAISLECDLVGRKVEEEEDELEDDECEEWIRC